MKIRNRMARCARSAARFLVALLSICLLFTCRGPQRFERPIPVDATFRVADAEPAKRERYELAARYSAAAQGLALLVIEDDAIVYEEYQNGHTAESPAHVFSGTKTFAGVLALAAVADGKLDLDAPVSNTLKEFRGDHCRSKITARQLLQFTSGLKQEFWKLTYDGLFPEAKQRVRNRYAYALRLPCATEPGSTYSYGSSHLMVFGALLKRTLREDPLRYLERRVFAPISFRYSGWLTDRAGNSMWPYGAWTTAREWAKFGLLLRDMGRYRGRVVLPEALMRHLLQGSQAMPAYGLSVWLNRRVEAGQRAMLIRQLRPSAARGPVLYPDGPDDLFAAAGHKGNRLYVVPSRKLVVVRLGDGERSFVDEEFLARVLDGRELTVKRQRTRPLRNR